MNPFMNSPYVTICEPDKYGNSTRDNPCSICAKMHKAKDCPIKCRVCGKRHLTNRCPDRCGICMNEHTTANHYCCICKTVSPHKMEDCPENCTCGGFHRLSDHKYGPLTRKKN